MAYQGLARRLKFLAQSLRRHGPGHVVEVFRQASVRRAYRHAPLSAPTRDELLKSHSAASIEPFLSSFAKSASHRLPISLANRKEFMVGLLERSQGYDAILEDADRFSEGRFLALGISTVEPGGNYDWHRDYGSGRRWPSIRCDEVDFMSGDGSDVKFPWELSRCYWIGWLGKAYWISSNGAWSREFVRQIDSWNEANPLNIGVNWAMPMEVGIRSFWLAMGFGLFHGAPNIAGEWWVDYLRLAWAHGSYLENNLEYFSNLTNHYIANCFGLVSVGVLFADTVDGRRWLVEGRRRLEEEIAHQVLDDGTHYERSLPYHKLVLEMYLISSILLERSGLAFGKDTLSAIERMCELLVDTMLPDGTMAQIGDADDGVILRTTQDHDVYDARDVAAIAAVLFFRPEFAGAAGAMTQGAIMMTGGAGFEAFRSIQQSKKLASRLYPDGGFAVMRSSTMSIIADVGPIGLHGNNDTLSFVLSDGVGAIIIDPGTYCYTRSEVLRNHLRSTAAHNAPAIDGREIAEFDGLWRVRADRTDTEVLEWSEVPPRLRAHHRGYADCDVVVEREWSISVNELSIVDRLHGKSLRDVSTRFTLAPTIEAVGNDAKRITLVRDGAQIGTFESSEQIAVVDDWYSPSYGVAASTKCIVMRASVQLPSVIRYIWRPRIT